MLISVIFSLALQITLNYPLKITTLSSDAVKNGQKRIVIDLIIDARHKWPMGYYRSSPDGFNDI